MQRLPVFLMIGSLVMIGSMTWAHTCYFCEDKNDPFGSDCWNKTEQVAKIVNCTKPCYTTIFQSGGNNYWSIKRGCTGLNNEEDTCEESSNCNNKHFGACVTCCSEDLCNSVTSRYSLQSTTLLCLITSLLVSLRYLMIFM